MNSTHQLPASLFSPPSFQVWCLLHVSSVMISYLDGCTFLLCVLCCLFFPLGLTLYLEDQYVFSLGPHSFSLSPIPEGNPTPVPALLFTS